MLSYNDIMAMEGDFMDKGVLTPEEAADYLGVHPQTVYKLLRKGELPGKKIGQLWRISKQVIVSYLEGNNQSKNRLTKTPDEVEPGTLVSSKLWQLAGLWDSEAPEDVAENHDQYLAERYEGEGRK